MGWVKLAVGGGSAFWLSPTGEVFRASEEAGLDTTQAPMGKRWECSYTHWLRYRTVYGWAVDVVREKQ
jgi:hypothetical protein